MPSYCLYTAAINFVNKFFKQPVPARQPVRYSFGMENLEERQLLAANLVDDIVEAPEAEVTFEVIPVTVRGMNLRVNGHEMYVDPSMGKLALNAGDYLEVVSLDLFVGFGLQSSEGVFAVEGYVNKISSDAGRSETDYTDGRFSARSGNAAVAMGDIVQGGLDGGWTVEDGWDRLTLNVVHYFGNDSSQEAAVSLLLEVGTPDFSFGDDIHDAFASPISVGEVVNVTGSWFNTGDGRYHNYAEVDIFYQGHDSPEWVGVLVGNADSANGVSGEFLFPTENGDMFTERWTPSKAGNYRIEFTVDPEKIWDESNEDNNRVRIDVTVFEQSAQVEIGDLGRGIVSQDRAQGEGFILYTEEGVDERFKENKVYRGNADHFVTVRFHDGQWQYDTNHKYVNFDIRASDILIAKVDFTNDKVEMLEGVNYSFNGVQMGYRASDVQVIQDRWYNRFNDGDFGIEGTFMERHLNQGDAIDFVTHSIEADESLQVGSVLGQLNGNQEFRFEIVDGNEQKIFDVDNSGNVILSQSLDFETQESHRLTVTATSATEKILFDVEIKVNDSITDDIIGVGELRNGVAARDNATGEGFIMFSQEDVHDRFASSKVLSRNAVHLISVKLIDGQWHIDNNYKYIAFTPSETDVLVAKVNYDQNTAEVLAGMNTHYEGIQLGVAKTDISIKPEFWGHHKNKGEFAMQGTKLVLNG